MTPRSQRNGGTVIAQVGWVLTLMLVAGSASPLLAQLDRPPAGYTSPTIAVAGPSWITAEAFVPMRMDVKWAAVPTAASYRLVRWIPPDATEQLLQEIPANTGDQDLANKSFYYFDYLAERSGGVAFAYKAYAMFVGSDGSKTISAPNPIAIRKALTPAAPAKLKWRAAVSPIMGRLRVILDWDPVPAATGYYLLQIARPPTPQLPMLPATVARNTMTIDNIVPGQGATVCVVTVYEVALKDATVRTCDLVTTKVR